LSARKAGDRPFELSLFTIGALLPVLGGGNDFFNLEPPNAIRALALGLFAVTLVFRREPASPPSGGSPTALAALIVLVAWWSGTLLLRPSGPRAVIETIGLFGAALLYALLRSRALDTEELHAWIRGLVAGTLVTAIYGQYQYWVVFPTLGPLLAAAGASPRLYVNANFYTANCYAPFVASVLLLFLGSTGPGTQPSLAYWSIAMVLGIVLLLTKSRATLALFAAAVLLLSLRGVDVPTRRRWTAAALAAVLVAIALVNFNAEELWNVGALGRITIWRGALRMIREHWLVGVGIGRFWDHFTQYRLDTYYTRYPHDFLLEAFAELGIVGITALIVWLVAAGSDAIREWRSFGRKSASSTAILLAIGLLVVHAMVDIDWHAPANPMLLFALMGIAQHPDRLVERRSEDG
jgi:O-antigen ligase